MGSTFIPGPHPSRFRSLFPSNASNAPPRAGIRGYRTCDSLAFGSPSSRNGAEGCAMALADANCALRRPPRLLNKLCSLANTKRSCSTTAPPNIIFVLVSACDAESGKHNRSLFASLTAESPRKHSLHLQGNGHLRQKKYQS